MGAGYTERVEEGQAAKLDMVQSLLNANGIRTLLIRRVRLTLLQNSYQPLQRAEPLLLAGTATVSVTEEYHVETSDGRSTDFADPQEVATYLCTETGPSS